MDPALSASLAAVARLMSDARAQWWVIGSAAVVVHGVSTDVADVDVLLGAADADALAARLSLSWVEEQGDGLFRSERYGRWTGAGMPVEFMAGLHVRGERLVPTTRLRRQVGNATIYVPDRRELIAILDQFDRPKDRRRAALLRGMGPDPHPPSIPLPARKG